MEFMSILRSQGDRLAAAGCTLAGAVILYVGWLGVSGTPLAAEQLPYIVSAGLGGLSLIGVAATLWLSADLRDEWRKLDQIEQAIRESGVGREKPAAEPPAQPIESPTLSLSAPVSTGALR